MEDISGCGREVEEDRGRQVVDVFRAECVRSGLEARQHVKLFQYSGEILCPSQPGGGTQTKTVLNVKVRTMMMGSKDQSQLSLRIVTGASLSSCLYRLLPSHP